MVPSYKALFEHNDPTARMIALANHNNDLAEYWEWSDTGLFGVDPTHWYQAITRKVDLIGDVGGELAALIARRAEE